MRGVANRLCRLLGPRLAQRGRRRIGPAGRGNGPATRFHEQVENAYSRVTSGLGGPSGAHVRARAAGRPDTPLLRVVAASVADLGGHTS